MIMKSYSFCTSRRAQGKVVAGLTFVLVILAGMISPLQAQQGITPTILPAGGCAIDGNLLARVPVTALFTPNHGDLLPNDGAPGSGGYVFTSAGLPVDTATSFHLLDGYDMADAGIFTGGSKFNNNPNTWKWKSGKPVAKDDIHHSLFFFASDAAGNLWFTGSGDRKSVNGNTYLDFELLQSPLYKNPDGTFTSLGPDGGRTAGDLAVTIWYTNGGSNAQLYLFQWAASGQGGFTYVPVTPAAGTVFLATNKDSAVVVPYGAFGAGFYPMSAFTEVACNLNGLIAGAASCLDIKTVIVKTKASQAVNAELKDFIDPVQVNIGSAPQVSVNDAIICHGDTALLTATVLSGAGPFSWLWSTGDTTSSISVSPDTTTQYTVVVTAGNGCTSLPDTSTVTVLAGTACSITGPDTICPAATVTYTGPDSLSAYAWTISGAGAIQGSSTDQVVTVLGGGICDSSFILTLVVSDSSGCTGTCSKAVALMDTITPVITDVPAPLTVQCASQVPLAGADTVTVTDNCAGAITLVIDDSVTGQTCPNRFTLIRTWTATDACGNMADATQVITVFDSIAPLLQGVPADTGICCADSIPAAALVTATDLCDDTVAVAMTEVVSDSTGPNMFILTRTWTAADSCGNTVTDSQVITVNDTLYESGFQLGTGAIRSNVITNLKVTPNPFTTDAVISFDIQASTSVSVDLYNAIGLKLRSLFNGEVTAGTAFTLFLSSDASMTSGMYLLVVRTDQSVLLKRIILAK